jgi:Uma2 family endonuclease
MKMVEPVQLTLHGAQVWPLSVAAYHALGEAGLIPKDTELLYGVVYKKMSKSPLHSFWVIRLLRLLQAVVSRGYLLRSEQPLTCGDSEPEPDVSIVRGAETDFLSEHPHTAELVVEICMSSHDYDRSKLPAYAAAGVKECWLILGPEKQVEVHRQPLDGKYTERAIHVSPGVLVCGSLPQFTLDLETFFLTKPQLSA